ncbi:hypothetical protein FAZ19_08390 [Sphingobacterium alkalisoli]|uniref:DUF5689 domain-containing protein n=1 Tax=Sphingobacterium alkalisoli TaxID=1874115 RepID=A0A4U0H8W7_9SPHI|nr:DUF5689 domain-containing protein [Sphingobacterium alkalisoli]TJY66912.1 hypothetical protein FAZ19_08390 [Sphingobacterium alkalisoli]GGH13443.1 hypothetical protein GCM10011418_13650 [Sphingobacterium alkalisoli]
MKTKKLNVLLYIGISFSLLAASCIKEDTNYAIGTNNPEISLYAIRNVFQGNDIILDTKLLTDATYTRAVVISDHTGNNLPANYIAVQNVWRNQQRGILLEVEDAAKYNFGDSIQINLTGALLTKKNGPLTLKGVKKSDISVINTGNDVTSKGVAISVLLNKFNDYESTFIDVTADLEVEPAPGTPIRGTKTLMDQDSLTIELFTSDQASFADEVVAPSATFRGIAFIDGNKKQLRLQNYAGMAFPSGKIYAGWPETFETETIKGGYANANVTLSTGTWYFQQCLLGVTAGRDRIISGIKAVRFQQGLSTDALLQMNFDVPNGASKVTLWYGAYYTDNSSTFTLEYSQDGGVNWQQIGDPIKDAHKTSESLDSKQAVFLMDIEGPVRFRVNKKGIGANTNSNPNGRLGMDDISIFRSY